jgi:hypothetical protein
MTSSPYVMPASAARFVTSYAISPTSPTVSVYYLLTSAKIGSPLCDCLRNLANLPDCLSVLPSESTCGPTDARESLQPAVRLPTQSLQPPRLSQRAHAAPLTRAKICSPLCDFLRNLPDSSPLSNPRPPKPRPQKPRPQEPKRQHRGDRNQAHRNRGDRNRGQRNRGDKNRENRNRAHRNRGDRNRGQRNRGDKNRENRNRAHRNRGHRNRGHKNRGHRNRGHRNRVHETEPTETEATKTEEEETEAIKSEATYLQNGDRVVPLLPGACVRVLSNGPIVHADKVPGPHNLQDLQCPTPLSGKLAGTARALTKLQAGQYSKAVQQALLLLHCSRRGNTMRQYDKKERKITSTQP